MPVVASATLEVTPVLSGAQQSLTEQLTGATEAASEKAGESSGKKLGGSLVKGLAAGSVALAGAAAGVGTALIATAGKTAEYGDQIDKASQKLGVSSTFYQEWEAVLQHSGTSMDRMGASFKRLSTASQDATDDQVAAFEKLGLSMDDVANMSTEELFSNVVSGLQGMEEGTERTALATELLGKGAMEMGALFNTSAEDTQGMIDTVHELGGVMSEDAVKASAQYQDSLQDMQTAFAGIKNGVLTDLLPVLSDVMTGVSDFLTNTDLTPLTDTLSGAVSAVGEFVSSLDITEIGNTFQTVVVGIGEILGGVMGIVQNVVTQAQTSGTLVNAVWESLQIAASAAFEVVQEIITLVSALIEGDWSAAWESAQNIVETIWEAITNILTTAWEGIKSAASSAWNGIKSAISAPIQTVKSTLASVWSSVQSTAISVWNGIKGAAMSVWNGIKTAVTTPISVLRSTLSSAWNGIRSTAASAWERIKTAITKPIESARNTVKGIVDKIKGFFPLSIGNIFSNFKLPHLDVTAGSPPYGIGGMGQKPSFSVKWYAKAVNEPYLFTDPVLFGAGETADEVMYGRENLMNDIREAVGGGGNTYYVTINVDGAENPEDYARRLARQLQMELRMA